MVRSVGTQVVGLLANPHPRAARDFVTAEMCLANIERTADP
jgi:hypothetical protein